MNARIGLSCSTCRQAARWPLIGLLFRCSLTLVSDKEKLPAAGDDAGAQMKER
jgi:hypothetical protein